MRLFALLFAVPAFAQDPTALETTATPGDLVAGRVDITEMWVSQSVSLTRTPDQDSATVGDLTTGDRVQLVLADGDRYRVLKGTMIGWLDATSVSMVPPPTETAGALGIAPPVPAAEGETVAD